MMPPIRSVNPSEKSRAGTAVPEWVWWLALAVALAPVCWCQIHSSDVWWHVALGRSILEKRGWPDFATFYFTPVHSPVPDLRWTAAGDVLLFLAHRLGGTAALQAISIGCLFAALALLRSLHRGAMNGWLLALLFAVGAATHQLQIPRNAVFSLPLMALVFWIFARFRERRALRVLWWYPPLLGLWGVLHGSYLLGLVLVALLLFGDWLEALRQRRPDCRRLAAHGCAILALACAINATGNPEMLSLPKAGVRSILRMTGAAKHSAPRKQESERLENPAPVSWKDRLNSVIWTRSPDRVRSGDFDSPFDRLSYRPVLVGFLLSLLAGARVLLRPHPPMGWTFAFAGAAFLGLCYLRMTGYAAIGAAAILLTGDRVAGRFGETMRRHSRVGAACTVALASVFYGGWHFGKAGDLLGHSAHLPGAGKICTFDDAACDWIFLHHRERPVFTTIVTGSYALSRWAPAKPVFVDGFFAPHPSAVWKDYAQARDRADLGGLHRRYGTQLALVEHTRRDWTRSFIASKDWQPAAIGLGCMVYVHRSVASDAVPALLFSSADARRLAPVFREGLAYDYYGALVALFTQRRDARARELVKADPALFAELRSALHPADRWVLPPIEESLRETGR